MIHPLLKNISSLDFSNAKLVRDFGNLFINYANMLGWGIGTPVAAAVRSEMLMTGKKWLKEVYAAVENNSSAYALTVYSAYDWGYRIVYNNPPYPEYTYGIVSHALDARIHGEKDIDIYELYRLIDFGLMCDFDLYKEKTLLWRFGMLDTWHKEFQTGRYFDPRSLGTFSGSRMKIADSDVLNRIAILLGGNLKTFEPDQKSFKRRLFDNHRHYIDDLLNGCAGYDTATIMALGNFINASGNNFITQEERTACRSAALAALYSKTDTPYLKASLEIMLAAEKQIS